MQSPLACTASVANPRALQTPLKFLDEHRMLLALGAVCKAAPHCCDLGRESHITETYKRSVRLLVHLLYGLWLSLSAVFCAAAAAPSALPGECAQRSCQRARNLGRCRVGGHECRRSLLTFAREVLIHVCGHMYRCEIVEDRGNHVLVPQTSSCRACGL
jgi:hypothetical protein